MGPTRSRRWLSRPLAPLAIVIGLAGCASSTTTRIYSPPPPRQILRVGFLGIPGRDVTSLDPDLVVDRDTNEIDNLLYDGLVALDANLRVEAWGADRIEISPDGLTYTFHLRAGQRFSDGTPVVPSDYAYSINRALDPCTGAINADHLYVIKDAVEFNDEICLEGGYAPGPSQTGPTRATLLGDSILPHDDDGTLTITLQRPAGYFLTALAYPTAYAVDPRLVELDPRGTSWQSHLTDGPTGRGGSGMYYLKQWDQAEGRLTLEPNPHWWGRATGLAPNLRAITFSLFADGAAALSAYDAGALDVTQVDPATVPSTRADIQRTPMLAIYALAFDWRLPPFDNADARLALCLTVPRGDVAAADLAAPAEPYGALVPGGMAGYQPAAGARLTIDLGDPQRNETAAQAAWQRYLATLHGSRPPAAAFSYLVSMGHSYGLEAGQDITQAWARVLGVRTALEPISGDALRDANSPNPTLLYWSADYPDPEDFLSALLLPGAPLDLGHADVPQADALLRQADASTDQTQRFALYRQAEGLLLDQVALCPLAQQLDVYTMRHGVAGYGETGLGLPANDIWTRVRITTATG